MKKTLTVILAVLLTAVLPTAVFASSYSINRAVITVEVGKDAVHYVSETYDVYFNEPLHGIYREIPVGYLNGQRARVSLLDASPKPVEMYESSFDYVKYRFGEENTTYRGENEYSLYYSYDTGEDLFEEGDAFYFNLIGEGWEVALNNVYFFIVFPEEIDLSGTVMYSGPYSGEIQQEYYSEVIDGRTWVYGYCETLKPGDELSIYASLPENWYVGAREIVNRTPMWAGISAGAAVLCVVLALFVWSKFGKDKVPVVVASDKIIPELTPLMAGYLADFRVDDKDVTSMLFFWADKGYLKIEEGSGKDEYVFTKLSDLPADSNGPEKYLFNAFFSCGRDGVVKTKDLEKKFYEKMLKTKEHVMRFFTRKRALFNTKSSLMQVLLFFVSFVPFAFAAITCGWDYFGDLSFTVVGLGIAFVVLQGLVFFVVMRKWDLIKTPKALALILASIPTLGAVAIALAVWTEYKVLAGQMVAIFCAVFGSALVLFLASITEQRSEYGQKCLESVLGLREYIEKVEINKLMMLIDEDPEYYYHMLSYAIVFKLENKWADKFRFMTLPAPSWYRSYGRVDLFDVMMFNSFVRNCNTGVTRASHVMPESHSSKSPGVRFGGGSSHGFSGGGFGGGGGGAW